MSTVNVNVYNPISNPLPYVYKNPNVLRMMAQNWGDISFWLYLKFYLTNNFLDFWLKRGIKSITIFLVMLNEAWVWENNMIFNVVWLEFMIFDWHEKIVMNIDKVYKCDLSGILINYNINLMENKIPPEFFFRHLERVHQALSKVRISSF